jgi:hypothetical protein
MDVVGAAWRGRSGSRQFVSRLGKARQGDIRCGGGNVAYNIGFFKSLWRSVVDQIVQEVPQAIEFCEFECTRKQCTLELTGTCDIRPQPRLVLIRPAATNLRPESANGSSRGVVVKPAHVA